MAFPDSAVQSALSWQQLGFMLGLVMINFIVIL